MRLLDGGAASWPGLGLGLSQDKAAAADAWRPFFPEVTWVDPRNAAAWLATPDMPPAPGRDRIEVAPGPWPWPRFGGRMARAGLIATGEGGVARPAHPQPDKVLDALRAARVAGPAGWPDPGPAGLNCARGEAVLVLDPCRPGSEERVAACWAAAAAGAGQRPVRAVRMRAGPAVLPGAIGPFAAWTLIEAAAEWWLAEADDGLGAIAAAAGVRVRGESVDPLARLLGNSRFADPFRGEPCDALDAIPLMEAWQRAARENAGIAVACGMAWWKRARIGQALAGPDGPPAFQRSARAAVATARRRGGAIAVWATRMPEGLPSQAAAAGVPVVSVEDGFLRSAGLGAGFLPGGSIALDAGGPAYDPGVASDLERLLSEGAFAPALVARAAQLRAALVARGVTKYNLPGVAEAPAVAPGRSRVLVPGQVEDDASVRLGALDGPRRNLDLLRAARERAGPDAFLLFRPHPDVAAGYRRGHVPEAEALRFADAVQADAAMPRLLDWADAVQTITSLTGFEALLRGKRVVCHGMPFYAGWGLTEDLQALDRRRRRLSLDELVAGALILYPRCTDPVTGLPCPPEVLVERLGQPEHWRAARFAVLRRWQGQAMAALARRGWLS